MEIERVCSELNSLENSISFFMNGRCVIADDASVTEASPDDPDVAMIQDISLPFHPYRMKQFLAFCDEIHQEDHLTKKE